MCGQKDPEVQENHPREEGSGKILVVHALPCSQLASREAYIDVPFRACTLPTRRAQYLWMLVSIKKCIANPKCYDSLNRQHIVLEILAPHKHLLSCGVLLYRTSADSIPMRACFELAGNNYFHFQLSEHDTTSGIIVRKPSRPPSFARWHRFNYSRFQTKPSHIERV
jgi:hypothetical protein